MTAATPPYLPDAALAEEPLWLRSVRFAFTVVAPIGVGLVAGPQAWLAYAMVSAITAYACDPGGPPLSRLMWMGVGAGAILAGATVGTLVAGHAVATTLAFMVAGVIYALSESAHQLTLTASRFLCFALAIAALYSPLHLDEVAAIAGFTVLAWVISVALDGALGAWRPSSAPVWGPFLRTLRATERRRWIFAAAVGITVPLAIWGSGLLGLQRPYWPLLALVLVLRVGFLSSGKLMLERFFGTLLGVVIAAAYAAFFPSQPALMLGIVIAALARWPAQQKHGALGVGALTAFVMLMVELVIASHGAALILMEERVVDTAVGCAFALFALGLDQLLWLVVPHRPR